MGVTSGPAVKHGLKHMYTSNIRWTLSFSCLMNQQGLCFAVWFCKARAPEVISSNCSVRWLRSFWFAGDESNYTVAETSTERIDPLTCSDSVSHFPSQKESGTIHSHSTVSVSLLTPPKVTPSAVIHLSGHASLPYCFSPSATGIHPFCLLIFAWLLPELFAKSQSLHFHVARSIDTAPQLLPTGLYRKSLMSLLREGGQKVDLRAGWGLGLADNGLELLPTEILRYRLEWAAIMFPSTEANPRTNTATLSSFSVTYDTVDYTYVVRLLGSESSWERWTHLHAIRARSYMMWMKEGSVGRGSCLLRLILGPVNKEE